MSDIQAALTEFHRVLCSGGRLALSDIYARNAEGVPALHTLPLSCGLRNALTREQLTENFQKRGFEIMVWEDHSEVLKQLVGQMILSHGLSDIYARNADGVPALHTLPLSCGLRNALTREQLTENFQKRGFEIMVWEDHSEVLKQLVGQMILSHGSMNEFWSQSEPEVDPMELQLAVRKAKLGYCLLVAQKSAKES